MNFLRSSERIHTPIWIFFVIVGSSISLSSCSALKSEIPQPHPPEQFSPHQLSEDPLTRVVLGGFNRSGSSPLHLLQSPQVKQELNLTENQITKLKEISQEARIQLQKTFSGVKLEQLEPQQRIQKLPELHRQFLELTLQSQEAVDNQLQTSQLKRFKEIMLQVYGFGIMTANQFSEELDLTSKQKKELADIHDQMLQEMSLKWQNSTRGNPDSDRIAREVNRQNLDIFIRQESQRSLAILTPEQRKILDSLKGETFVFTPNEGPPPNS